MENEIQEQMNAAMEEADLLCDYAQGLEEAFRSENEAYKLLVLDENLKMWVAIEASVKKETNFLPEPLKVNLKKLSKYVEQITLSKGINMTESYYRSLAEINRMISEGLRESVSASLAQQEAYFFAKSGFDLAEAVKSKDLSLIVEALDKNQKLWIMIKTLMLSDQSKQPRDIKENLIRLADYVAQNTIKVGQNLEPIDQKMVESFVSINKQIAEGLLGHQ